MSFKSLKEFGVSAERLGSFCKRWMTRVQRFVCKIVILNVQTFIYFFVRLVPRCCRFCFFLCLKYYISVVCVGSLNLLQVISFPVKGCYFTLIHNFQRLYPCQEQFVCLILCESETKML